MRRILSLTPEQQEAVRRKKAEEAQRQKKGQASTPEKRPKVDSLRAFLRGASNGLVPMEKGSQ
jgi:hypothetical protein